MRLLSAIRFLFILLVAFSSGCGSNGFTGFISPGAAIPSSAQQAGLYGTVRQLPDGTVSLGGSEGSPLGGLEIRLLGLGGKVLATTTSDIQGRFSLLPKEVEGRLEIRQGNQLLLTRDFSFVPGLDVNADLRPKVTRQQAIAAVLQGLPASALVRATHNPLASGSVIREAVTREASPPFELRTPDPGAYLFLIDFDPLSAWAHSAEIVLVNVETGQLTRQACEWWPSVDHFPILTPLDLASSEKTAQGFQGSPSRTIVQSPQPFQVADLFEPPVPRQLNRQADSRDCFAFLLPGTTEDWIAADVAKMKAWCLNNQIPEGNIVVMDPVTAPDDDNAYLLAIRQAYSDLQVRIQERNKAGGHTCLFVFVDSHGSRDGEIFVSTNKARLALDRLRGEPPIRRCDQVVPLDRTKACDLRLLYGGCFGANHIGRWRLQLEDTSRGLPATSTKTRYELYSVSSTGPCYLSSPQLAFVKGLFGQVFKAAGGYHVVEWDKSVTLRDCQITNFPPPRRTIATVDSDGVTQVVFDLDTTNPAFQGKAYTKTAFPAPFNPGDPTDPLNQRYANLFAYGQVSDWTSTSGGVDGCSVTIGRVELLDLGGFAFACAWDPSTGEIDATTKSNNTNLGSFGVGIVAKSSQATLYTTTTGQVQAHNLDSTGALTSASGSPYSVASGTIQLALTPGENFLYALSGQASQLAGFRRNPNDGSLTPLVGSPFATQTGPVGVCSFSNGGDDWVCTSNAAQLRSFRVANDGSLAATDTEAAPVFNLVGSSQQPFIYGDTVANTLRGFRLNPINGDLSPLPGSPYARGGNGPLGKSLIHSSLPFLISPNPGSADVSVQRIAADGSLSPVTGSPFSTVANPDTVAVSPNGEVVYVSSAMGGGISVFRIDASTGALTASGNPVPLNPSGLFFFP